MQCYHVVIFFICFFTGREKLQSLTKQSLKTKPFCLALNKDWTKTQSNVDLRQIFTDLSWTRKHGKAYTVEQEDLKNITQILNEEQLGECGPVRILVQGQNQNVDILTFTMQIFLAK